MMFGECYYDSWGRRVTHHTNFKRTEDAEADFNAWVRHFETQPRYPAEDFRCIDPREVQARHLSCGYAPNPEANHALSEPPDLGVARYLLRDADFVGVADFYDASVCLLTLRRTGALPPDCACSDAPLRRARRGSGTQTRRRSRGSGAATARRPRASARRRRRAASPRPP